MEYWDGAPGELPLLLTAVYGIAWAWSSVHPAAGVLFFAAVSLVASIPRLFKLLSLRIFMALFVGWLIFMIPMLWPLLIILALVNVFFILNLLFRNFFLVLAADAAYLLFFLAPRIRGRLSSLADVDHPYLWAVLLFLIGALALQVIFLVMNIIGYRSSQVARFCFNLAGFYIFLAVSVVLIFKGNAGHDVDFTGDGGSTWT